MVVQISLRSAPSSAHLQNVANTHGGVLSFLQDRWVPRECEPACSEELMRTRGPVLSSPFSLSLSHSSMVLNYCVCCVWWSQHCNMHRSSLLISSALRLAFVGGRSTESRGCRFSFDQSLHQRCCPKLCGDETRGLDQGFGHEAFLGDVWWKLVKDTW